MMPVLFPFHLLRVSERLVSARDVRSLGLHLGVEDHTINAALYNHRHDIQEAGYAVLSEWYKGQESRTIAWYALRGALRHPTVGLSHIAEKTFNRYEDATIEGKLDPFTRSTDRFY